MFLKSKGPKSMYYEYIRQELKTLLWIPHPLEGRRSKVSLGGWEEGITGKWTHPQAV